MLTDLPTWLEQTLHQMGLTHAARRIGELRARATVEGWSIDDALVYLLGEEAAGREAARIEIFRQRAGFPFARSLAEFDFTGQTDRRVANLGGALEPDFIRSGRSLVLSGRSQSGKTHLAVAIADRAIKNGFEARFFTADGLIMALADEATLADRLADLSMVDLLVIDDLAGVAYGPAAVERIFTVIHARHLQRRSIIVTSTREPEAWGERLGSPAVAEGIRDRLLERGRHVRLVAGVAPPRRRVDSQGIPIRTPSVVHASYDLTLVVPEDVLDLSPQGSSQPSAPAQTPMGLVPYTTPQRGLQAMPMHELIRAEPAGREADVVPQSQIATQVLPSDPGAGRPEHERDIGHVIEGYLVTRLLGAGGLGLVYVGMDARTRGEVAIKLLKREYVRHRDIKTRFLLEAQIPRLLKHQNVIQIFTGGQLPDGRPYYVMELLEGQSLRDRLQAATPLTVPDALRIFIDIADALRVVHKRGIVHRDLKPENLFLTFYASGQVVAKVMDFGIARVPLKIEGVDLDAAPLRTGGTPRYMAPERLRGEEGDTLVDLYALGLIMYEVFTQGGWPWDLEAEETAAQQEAHLSRKPRTSSRLQKCGPRLTALVMRCLEKDATARPQTADEVKAELVAAAAELPRRFAHSTDDIADVLARLRRINPNE